MSEKKEKSPKEEAEEVKEILSAVSTQVPALIKSVLASVFSEEAGRSVGKAAAAYYKELLYFAPMYCSEQYLRLRGESLGKRVHD